MEDDRELSPRAHPPSGFPPRPAVINRPANQATSLEVRRPPVRVPPQNQSQP